MYSSWQLFREHDGKTICHPPMGWPFRNFSHRDDVALVKAFVPLPSATVIRRQAFEELGGWDEAYSSGEDIKLWFDAATRGLKFEFLPTIGVLIRERADSLSRSDPVQLPEALALRAHVRQTWSRKGHLTREEADALATRIDNAAMGVFRHDQALFYETVRQVRSIRPWGVPKRSEVVMLFCVLFGYSLTHIILEYALRLRGR